MFNNELKELEQIIIFQEFLPNKPYCSDDVEEGLYIRPKNIAIRKKIIQPNTIAKVKWLVFDYDKKDILGRIEEVNAPYPNLLVTNRLNGHSHIFYSLNNPVIKTDQGRFKPLDYLAKVQYALRKKIGADIGYTNLVSKNPLHSDWLVTQLSPKSYDLHDLAEYLDLPLRLPPKAKDEGLGRNCTIFETVRKLAYKEVLKCDNKEQFFRYVLSECNEVNAEFIDRLHYKELNWIAKSISNWIWKRFSKKKFSEIQSRRGYEGGVKSGIVRALKNEDKRAEALKMSQEGATQRQIAKALDMSLGAINKWLKNAEGVKK